MMRQYKRNPVNPYLVQKIMSATPEQLVAYVYDFAATACAQNDSVKARKAVNNLIQALNFEYKETASTFLNVYQYLLSLINQRRFNEARAILVDLKRTWAKAFHLA